MFARTLHPSAWAAAFGILACSLGACAGGAHAAGELGPGADLAVRRGTLRTRLLLTGELKAAESEELIVPRTPNWQLTIRWMEEDGAAVKAGQRVVEFDNSSFTSALEEKRLSAAEAEKDLARTEAEAR